MKTVVFIDKGLTFITDLSEDCTTIHDSYRIKNEQDMCSIIYMLRHSVDERYAIYKRSVQSMITEWKTHNLLHSKGLFISRTATVDLEAKPSKLLEFAYRICAFFC